MQTKIWCGHAAGVFDDMMLLLFHVRFQMSISSVYLSILYIMILI